MPQSTDELRREWQPPTTPEEQAALDLTGSIPVDDAPACRYLEAAGYVLKPDWTWAPPTAYHTPTEKECRAVIYLIEEWDYGGIGTPA